MNGFEPLRRRIIDYTDAGQWSEVYDGPIEGFETEQLKAENAKLRELVRDYDKVLDAAVDVWGIMADALGYGRKYDALHDRMRELGIEVDG